MIKTNLAEHYYILPCVDYMGGWGFYNWSFTPYFAISLAPRPSDNVVSTTYLKGSRNRNGDNKCDHVKWEGNVDFQSAIGPWGNPTFHGAFGECAEYGLSWPRCHFFKILYPGDTYYTVCGGDYREPGDIYCEVTSLGGIDYRYGVGTMNDDGTVSGSFRESYFHTRNQYGSYVYKQYIVTYDHGIEVDRSYSREWATNEVYVDAFPNGYSAQLNSIEARFWSWAKPYGQARWLDPLTDSDAEYYAGNASQTAANGFNSVESNMITNVMELPDVGKSVESFVDLARNPNVRSAANAWLAYRYGDRLTAQDARQLISNIQGHLDVLSPNMIRISRGRSVHKKELQGFPQTLQYNCELRVRNGSNSLRSYVERLDQLGSLPTLARIWDAVPYSFVVDWFIQVSECCNVIDSWFKQNRLDITSCVESTKGIISVPSSRLLPETSGQIELSRYLRTPKSKPAMPVMDLDHLVSTPSRKNFLDGAALIIGNS